MVRIAQIGVGIWGSNLLRNFTRTKGAEVAIVCDKDPEKLKKAQALYPNLETTREIDDIFEKHKVDAVVIATPPSSHGKLALLALQHKKHVFVEKPIALTISEAEGITRKAKQEGLILMVGHLLLYHPAIRFLKKIMDGGELGEILYLYSTRVNLGQVRLEENAMWSLAPHDVSVAMYLLGEVPSEVSARGECYLQNDIEDVIFMSLKFKKKTLFNTHVSWLDPHKIRQFTIVGSKKMAVFNDMEPIDKIKIYDKGVEKNSYYDYQAFFTIRYGGIRIPEIELKEPLGLECEHFIQSVSQNKTPFTDGNNGLQVLSVLEAAQDSIKNQGLPVKVEYGKI